MNDLDKVRVLLPHWIEHNSGHGQEFARWAGQLRSAGHSSIADLLMRAHASLQEAEAALSEALRKSGGALQEGEHHHHHHHHNLPE